MIHQDFDVNFQYDTHFTNGVFNLKNKVLVNAISKKESTRCHKVLFMVEEVLLDHNPQLFENITQYCDAYSQNIQLVSSPISIKGGEGLKNFSSVLDMCQVMDSNRLCRQSFVIIVGGGAFIDAIGFAASIVHRGIRQIRIPTTVLAQNDSGVGVKNGINMFGKKNFIGCFAPPFSVINDSDFLKTLEYRDWISGIAEAFKVAIIKDGDFFQWLCDNVEQFKKRDNQAMQHLVKYCSQLHINHIGKSGDPFELGSARPLDFGHWAAHKLEAMSNSGIKHGEAVAIGLAIDSYYAVQKKFMHEDDFNRMISAFTQLGFKLWSKYLDKVNSKGQREILDGISEFREHLGGELHVTLPNGLGGKLEVSELDESIINEALDYLKTLK